MRPSLFFERPAPLCRFPRNAPGGLPIPRPAGPVQRCGGIDVEREHQLAYLPRPGLAPALHAAERHPAGPPAPARPRYPPAGAPGRARYYEYDNRTSHTHRRGRGRGRHRSGRSTVRGRSRQRGAQRACACPRRPSCPLVHPRATQISTSTSSPSTRALYRATPLGAGGPRPSPVVTS